MRTQSELLRMTVTARGEEMKAAGQAAQSGEDTTTARNFAAGVEAGILWALNYIGDIPFPTVKPSGNGPDEGVDAMLASLPGMR